eukprot:tig00001669_g9563.t1
MVRDLPRVFASSEAPRPPPGAPPPPQAPASGYGRPKIVSSSSPTPGGSGGILPLVQAGPSRSDSAAQQHYSAYAAGSKPTGGDGELTLDSLFEEEHAGIGAGRHQLEAASQHVAIKADNVGYRLLQKMGWQEGMGLGGRGHGRVEPIKVELKEDRMCLGRAAADEAELATTELASSRKLLEVERTLTPEQRALREAERLKNEAIHEERMNVISVFRCDLCNKQYTKATEYEVHLDSYDHHHKKRFAETKKLAQRESQADSARKEQKRMEKEMEKMRKMQQQLAEHQQRLGKAAPAASSSPAPAPAARGRRRSRSRRGGGAGRVELASGGGWSSVAAPAASGGGWASVAAPTAPAAPSPSPSPSPPPEGPKLGMKIGFNLNAKKQRT